MDLKGAVFDWDGTLADIDERELYCINGALEAHGFKIVDRDFYVRNYYLRPYEVGSGPRMVLEAAVPGDGESVEEVYETYRKLFAGTVDKAKLQRGAMQVLRSLKDG